MQLRKEASTFRATPYSTLGYTCGYSSTCLGECSEWFHPVDISYQPENESRGNARDTF